MGNLSLLLHQLHLRALRSAPAAQSMLLRSGLAIHLQLVDGETFLSLSRENVLPSAVEYQTVFSHYPESKPANVTPRASAGKQMDGRYHLIANWNTSAVDQFLNLEPLALQNA